MGPACDRNLAPGRLVKSARNRNRLGLSRESPKAKSSPENDVTCPQITAVEMTSPVPGADPGPRDSSCRWGSGPPGSEDLLGRVLTRLMMLAQSPPSGHHHQSAAYQGTQKRSQRQGD